MSMWDFIDAHPWYTVALGVFLLLLIEEIGSAVARARGKK